MFGRFGGSVSRSRWAAIGAVVAISLGAGGLLTASATGSAGASSFVPITPCRLMDTRAGAQVGPRGTPIGANETYLATVWGTNGKCTIPNTATAVSMNVTFVSPTEGGFVSVFPADKPWPGTSNLNFTAGQAAGPNAVTSALSADGRLAFLNAAGTVGLIADIVGYYEPSSSGPAGPAGPAGATGARGLSAWDTIPSGQTVTGNFGTTQQYQGPAFGDFSISLPAKAPVALVATQVNFAPDAAATSDDDAECTGTAAAPTAPAGKVCLYLYGSTIPAAVTNVRGSRAVNLSNQAFYLSYDVGAGTGTNISVFFTWAYTAP